MRRHWSVCSKRKLLLFILCLITCLTVELLSFWVASIYWKLPLKLSQNTTIVLLIADPQLIGKHNEPSWFGWLSRWDSDRYLHRGYSHAISVLKPHLEIFLGDIFDEGVIIDKHQFDLEVERFLHIFPLHSGRHRIYLPGDNDIGGEMEPVYSKLYERFKQKFNSNLASTSDSLKQLTIFKTNPLKYAEFEGIYGNYGQSNAYRNNPMTIRILLSHFPVIPMMTSKMAQELRQINIVLSAHDHTSALYVHWRNPPEFHKTASSMDVQNVMWTLSLENPAALPLVEFKVPTCNYRMGVPGMGYGLLFLTQYPENSTALAQFSILWLPGRFPQLIFYAILLLVLPILCVIGTLIWKYVKTKTAFRLSKKRKTMTVFRRQRTKEKQNDDLQALATQPTNSFNV